MNEIIGKYSRKRILALIDHDITPVAYTEGVYNTRLSYLKEVPPHKVIYHFEEVNLKLAKKELEDCPKENMEALLEAVEKYGAY